MHDIELDVGDDGRVRCSEFEREPSARGDDCCWRGRHGVLVQLRRYGCCDPCCVVATGFGSERYGSLLAGWSAAPIVSYTYLWNIGRTGDWSVTVSGLQFGLVGLSPTASLEDSTWDSTNHPCSCTSWTTGTAVVCNARASRAGLVREVVTVGGAVGTRTQTFTFDGTMHSIG